MSTTSSPRCTAGCAWAQAPARLALRVAGLAGFGLLGLAIGALPILTIAEQLGHVLRTGYIPPHGSLFLGNLQTFLVPNSYGNPVAGDWSANGLNLAAPVNAHLDTSLHFHVTPPITGGAGTTIGFTGDAGQTLMVNAAPLGFESVTALAALVVLTLWFPNDGTGEGEGLGSNVPVPDTAAVWGLLLAMRLSFAS